MQLREVSHRGRGYLLLPQFFGLAELPDTYRAGLAFVPPMCKRTAGQTLISVIRRDLMIWLVMGRRI